MKLAQQMENSPMAESDEDPRWKIVFEEAQRALTYQQAVLDNLRSRATVLTAAAALVSTLLGIPALKSGSVGLAAVVAIAAAALVVVCAGIVCAPWYKWSFTSDTAVLAANVKNGYKVDEVRENLATNFAEWHADNARRLGGLQITFTAGLGLLFVEILGWWLTLLSSGVVVP